MKKRLIATVMLAVSIGLVPAAFAADLKIKDGDTIRKVLEDHKGKVVTVRLADGDELTGTVRAVTKELLQLGELSGKEYFDGIAEVGKISAVIVRVKN